MVVMISLLELAVPQRADGRGERLLLWLKRNLDLDTHHWTSATTWILWKNLALDIKVAASELALKMVVVVVVVVVTWCSSRVPPPPLQTRR